MAADIYKDFPSAKETIDECNDILGGGLREMMFKGPHEDLMLTPNAQPAILCHSIAILQVLQKEFGFDINSCKYALGHSLGEYSALVATGALSFKNALKLVRLRGIAMQSCVTDTQTSMRALVVAKGYLANVEQEMLEIQKSMPKGEVAQIANINSRSQIVLSGTLKGVEYAETVLQLKGYAGRSLALPVSAPFHCSLMTPATNVLGPALEEVSFCQPKVDVIANVTAKPVGFKSVCMMDYAHTSKPSCVLLNQVTQTVQWEKSVRYAKEVGGVSNWIVMGPLRVLSNLLRKDYPKNTIRCDDSHSA
ncbi:hypothetical protein BDEG_24415 [Batrachochytrium dendrobatidis JEL423]|uniref:[acyl-carrier-protein] S-malonyltransferase n=1 Tax=Batrachochytrium dendrobatidis (strain JEL423) TaxID=403673 RepID=A0A177WMP9_BATDL|nr:hypothetical protein BDEG_24415 [Batrachochytrium dendrobatidis JEL423]